jgi:aspartyl-tRNA(Asn)/glutamyl-tRNA(Gln) amidotransferase subunit B
VEIERQIALLEAGGTVQPLTLYWDEVHQTVGEMRSKEEEADYRYFPEPDLPELVLDEALLSEWIEGLPELPLARRRRLVTEYDLREYDARVLCEKPESASYFEAVARDCGDGRLAANWIQTELLAHLSRSDQNWESLRVSPGMLAELLKALSQGEITGPSAKGVFAEMLVSGKPAAEIIEAGGLAQIVDETHLQQIVSSLLAENEANVARYRAGKVKLLEFFVGRVMAAVDGRARPQEVRRLLQRQLEE